MLRRTLIAAVVAAGLVLPASASATALAPFIDLQEKGLTMVDDGTGLEGLGSGSAELTVDVGGTVRFALLYWAGRDRPCASAPCPAPQPYKDQQMVFGGTPITGTLIGSEEQPATDGGRTNNLGYFADVTSLVSAAGPGLRTFTLADGNLASNLFRLDGASLIVAFTDPVSTVLYRVMIWDNLDFAFGNDLVPGPTRETAAINFSHGATPFARTGALTIVAGDGTAAGADRVSISNNADRHNCLDGGSGARWDNDTFPVSVPAMSSSTTTQVFSDPGANADSLLWMVAMLRVPVDAADAAAADDCPPAPLLAQTQAPDPAPVLSGLRVRPKALNVATPGKAAKSATKATISYTSSETASVTFQADRIVKGARVGGRCVKRTLANAKRKRCNRFVRRPGHFTDAADVGPNSLPFAGRIGKRALSPGRYRLTATAIDAGGKASQPVSTGFSITPRPPKAR